MTVSTTNKWNGESTIRPAGGVNVLNSPHLVAPAASIISPRSGAREYKRCGGAKSKDGAHHGGGLPRVTVDSSHKFRRTGAPCLFAWITVFRLVSRILTEAQRRVAGWSYFQFRRVHQRRKRRCTMKKPPLCRSPTMEVSTMCSHYTKNTPCVVVTGRFVSGRWRQVPFDEQQVGLQQYLDPLYKVWLCQAMRFC